MKEKIFISYSTANKDLTDKVCSEFESAGLVCWMAPRDIMPGADWAEAIIDAIDEAKTMVVVFTPEANESVQVKREIERAVSKNTAVLPLKLGDFAPSKSMEYFLSSHHWHILNESDVPGSLESVIQKLGGSKVPVDSASEKKYEEPVKKDIPPPPPKAIPEEKKKKSKAPIFITIAVIIVGAIIAWFLWGPSTGNKEQIADETSFISPADMMSSEESGTDDKKAVMGGKENIDKIYREGVEIEGGEKVFIPEDLGENLELISSSDLAYDVKEKVGSLTLNKFADDQVPVNLMIGNVIDEQVAAGEYLGRLLSMSDVKIKVVKVNKSDEGKINELFIESDQ